MDIRKVKKLIELLEEAAGREDTNYALGSVLNHVLLHQTIIGLEAKKQLEKVVETPDIVVGCAIPAKPKAHHRDDFRT